MKKKLLTIMLASTMVLGACGNQANNDKNAEQKVSSQEAAKELGKDSIALVNGEKISKDDYKKRNAILWCNASKQTKPQKFYSSNDGSR